MKSMIGIVTGLFILSGTGLFLPLSAENENQEGPPPAN